MNSDRVNSIEVAVEGLDHPEGVVYDHLTDTLYAGGEQGQIYRVDLDRAAAIEIARTPGFALGMAIDGTSRVVICDSADGSVWVLDGDRLSLVADSVGGRKLALPNYPAFAPDGSLYVTDSGAWKTDTGMTFVVRPDGSLEIVDETLCRFPNGCAVTADGKDLWILQSEGEDLHRIDLEGGGKPELIARLPDTVPDGIAFTEDGGAVLSCYRPDRIYYLTPEGELEILAEDPQGTLLAAPTNVCFIGPRRTTLISANLGRWHLTRLETSLIGVIPHMPARWAIDQLDAR